MSPTRTLAAAPVAASSRSATDVGDESSLTLPVSGIPARLVWLARLWRCREPACLVKVFTEQHELVPPRAKVTSRAASWATDALTFDDTTVSALARHLGVDWHTCWDAVEADATRRLADPARLDGVEVLGVDEHIVRHEALLFRMEVRDRHRLVVVATR
ncbi:MAG: hypothetical protein M3130_03540 [Actinomycetota bacterium]|nr:hypothetical protein [Actinomycetota bacterium]MDQ6945614.1 hypothetical protein [Actinomycetota bacterium]